MIRKRLSNSQSEKLHLLRRITMQNLIQTPDSFYSPLLPADCVIILFMVREACPEQPFILREPQDERLVEGLTTNGIRYVKNQSFSRSS